MTPLDPLVEAMVSRLSNAQREAFEVRAGVLQFEQGRTREIAESLALLEVLRLEPLTVGVVCVQAHAHGATVYFLAATEDQARLALSALVATGAVNVDLPMALHRLGGAARLTAIP